MRDAVGRYSGVAIKGVPLDLGSRRRGVDGGPSAIRMAGLNSRLTGLGYVVSDFGNVAVSELETCSADDAAVPYVKEVTESCRATATFVEKAASDHLLPLLLGGDQSVAIGSVLGAARHVSKCDKHLGVICLDRSAGLDTSQMALGNIYEMAVRCILGQGPVDIYNSGNSGHYVLPRNVAVIGVRGPTEERDLQAAKAFGINIYTMRDIDELGVMGVVSKALQALRGTAAVHVSLSMRVIDPHEAPGTTDSCPGGMSFRSARLAMDMIADSGQLRSMDVTEVNVINDRANRTAEIATDLIVSALRRRVPPV